MILSNSVVLELVMLCMQARPQVTTPTMFLLTVAMLTMAMLTVAMLTMAMLTVARLTLARLTVVMLTVHACTAPTPAYCSGPDCACTSYPSIAMQFVVAGQHVRYLVTTPTVPIQFVVEEDDEPIEIDIVTVVASGNFAALQP